MRKRAGRLELRIAASSCLPGDHAKSRQSGLRWHVLVSAGGHGRAECTGELADVPGAAVVTVMKRKLHTAAVLLVWSRCYQLRGGAAEEGIPDDKCLECHSDKDLTKDLPGGKTGLDVCR